jgi:renalase
VRQWAQPLADATHARSTVQRIERDALDASRWQVRAGDEDGGVHVHSGFDAVLLAMPHVQAIELLQKSEQAPRFTERMAGVQVAPCWTLMIAFPQAMQPAMQTLGPQWNAARSTHHRIAWLARESSKPQRGPIERWTVQASPQWSQEHLEDDADRVIAKLLKAFAEITGIHAQPAHAVAHRWRYAQTVHALGAPFLWDAQQGLGVCGDWCLGHRVEDAFLSGLELALTVL